MIVMGKFHYSCNLRTSCIFLSSSVVILLKILTTSYAQSQTPELLFKPEPMARKLQLCFHPLIAKRNLNLLVIERNKSYLSRQQKCCAWSILQIGSNSYYFLFYLWHQKKISRGICLYYYLRAVCSLLRFCGCFRTSHCFILGEGWTNYYYYFFCKCHDTKRCYNLISSFCHSSLMVIT